MTKVITINERGTLTLPKEMRSILGVEDGGQVIIDTLADGSVALRAGYMVPLEIYSDDRIEEFDLMNEEPLRSSKSKWQKKN